MIRNDSGFNSLLKVILGVVSTFSRTFIIIFNYNHVLSSRLRNIYEPLHGFFINRNGSVATLPETPPLNGNCILSDEDRGAPVGGIAKRILDIAVALSALIVLAPLLLIVTVLVYLCMGRPIFFSHQRVGFNGKKFPCYKFRSMINDAEKHLREYLEKNPEAKKEWEQRQKLTHDPRVTLVGQIIRKTSIDELPQFWNVIRGDMSCVGPRPIITSELNRYGDHASEYMKVRPGITGLWQVSGRNQIEYSDRVALDTEYVNNWSIWLDVQLMFKTVPIVLFCSDQTS